MDVVPLNADTPRALVESWHALHVATDLELEPQVPPAPLDEAFASALSDDLLAREGWLSVDGDTVIGYALLELPLLDNPHLGLLDVRVDIGRRREGVATELVRRAARAAKRAGRRTILVEALDKTAGDAACAALGGHSALGSTSSTLSALAMSARNSAHAKARPRAAHTPLAAAATTNGLLEGRWLSA